MKRTRRRGLDLPSPSATAPAPPPPQKSFVWRPHALRILALWALALLAYSNSFRGGLVLDNAFAVAQDTRVRALTSGNLHLILSEELWYRRSSTGLYRPLTTFSYLLNYAVLGNGTNTAGYHAVNLALHLANTALVYILACFLLENAMLAWALAGLWCVHPLLTESVTNIVGRADLLAGFGVLAGLLCHIQASRGGRGRLGWLLGVALAATIGIFSKESGAVLPGLMLLYDLTWPNRSRWKNRLPGYLILVLPFAAFFSLRATMQAHSFVGLVPFGDNPLLGTDFWTAKITAIKVIGKYLWLFLWPDNLSADYSYNAVPLFAWRFQWEDTKAILALIVCAVAAVAAIRSYRGQKPVFFLIGFFFLTLAPTCNIVLLIGTIMAERFLYLPTIGLAGCLIVALGMATRHLKVRWTAIPRLAALLVLLICAALATRTFFRNFDWSDEHSLGVSTAKAAPDSFKAHFLYAASLFDSGPSGLDPSIAEADHMLAILESVPDEKGTPKPYETSGMIYRTKGDNVARRAVSGEGHDAAYWYRKALATLLRGSRIEHAETEEIRQLNREHGKATAAPVGWDSLYLELARVYARLNDVDHAQEILSEARLRRPDAEFSEEMAKTWREKGDPDKAAVALIEGIVTDPNATRLPAELLDLYQQTASSSCAVRGSGTTASVNLECPLVHNHFCAASYNVVRAYLRYGQSAKASATARSAIQDFGCRSELFE